jgi:hypothetical protein
MTATPRFAVAVFAALSLCLGAAAASALEPQACRALFPTFERTAHARPAPDAARYPGGARLSFPVAAPCPRDRRPAAA